MECHIDVCRASYYHLRNFGLRKKKFTIDNPKVIVHAMMILRLDMKITFCTGGSWLLARQTTVSDPFTENIGSGVFKELTGHQNT